MFENLRLPRSAAALGAAALTALAVGGVAIAQSSGSTTTTPATPSAQSQQQGAEPAEANEPAGAKENDAGETGGDKQLTGPDADRAQAAALAEVGSGKVTDVSSEKADTNETKDAAEPKRAGEPADPAYESSIAYTVEVTKADGSAVDVHLDAQFKVLGTEKEQHGQHGDSNEGAETTAAPATAG